MQNYTYKVVPFIGQIKSGQNAGEVSRQLQSSIDQVAKEGWGFYQLTNTNIEIKPGCIEGLFGSVETTSTKYQRSLQLMILIGTLIFLVVIL